MEKYLLSFVFIFSLLFAGIAQAEVTSTANRNENRNENGQNFQENRASATAEIKRVVQQEKDAIEMRIGKKLDAQKTKIANEFENAVRNEQGLIMRTQSRISMMSMENIDVASSSVLLEKAKSQLALAETELAKLENLLVQNIPSATSTMKTERNTILQAIKAQSEKTKTAIKTVHATIVDVISSLKKGLMKKETTSTSTEKKNN